MTLTDKEKLDAIKKVMDYLAHLSDDDLLSEPLVKIRRILNS